MSSLDLSRLLRFFSNAVRNRFIRAINSAEGTVPIPGRRCTDRLILAGVANLNMGNNRGTKSHPLTRKILPVTRFSPRKVSTKAAAVSLFAIALSRYLGNLTQGIVMNFVRGLVSPSQQPQPPQQPQQRSGPSNPQYTQQVPGPTSPNPMMISPPITPMSSGGSLKSLGMGGPMSSGMFDPMSPGTPTPTTPGLNQQYYSPSSPTSPGIQDPNANNQANGQHFWSPPLPSPHISKQNPTPGQKSTTMSMAMNSQMISAGGGGNQSSRDLNFDPNQSPTTSNNYPNSNQFPVPVQAQAQAQLSVQVTSPPRAVEDTKMGVRV